MKLIALSTVAIESGTPVQRINYDRGRQTWVKKQIDNISKWVEISTQTEISTRSENTTYSIFRTCDFCISTLGDILDYFFFLFLGCRTGDIVSCT